jgi:hypothetical protein
MAHGTCSVEGCEKAASASRGWCWAHYQRWRAKGDVQTHVPVLEVLRGPTSVRLAAHTDASAGRDACWVFTGHRTVDGYGRIRHNGRESNAHRVAYELARGPIPAGLVVCHRCDNPPCVNPAHLWLGTQADNIADMDAKGRRVAPGSLVTHCPRGHAYDEANTHVATTGSRHCRACGAEKARAKRARERDPDFDRGAHGRRVMHLRWHERRGVTKPGCEFCPDADGVYACP